MNKQRKVVITTTYNELGIIIDTKTEEVQLATDTISRQAAIDTIADYERDSTAPIDYKKIIMTLPTAEPIRCNKCKYQDKGQNESESWNLCGYRPWLYVPTDDDHFCGYAERRQDG